MSLKARRMLLQDLSMTWIVQRLKQIELSAVPSWLSPNVSRASRYDHSVGVGQLSLEVSGDPLQDQLLLTAAAILHDVGNGPFPHISDKVMEEIVGFRHEAAIQFAFENSPLGDSRVLDRYNLDLEEIASIVRGDHRLSPFLNGRLDLDSVDNIYRFIMTIPGRTLGNASYEPSEVVKHFSLGHATKTPEAIRRKWLADWEKAYAHLWNDRLNMIGWTMLGRALRILKKEITPRFFLMNNEDAFGLIGLRLPTLAQALMKRDFEILLDQKYVELRGEARSLLDSSGLERAESELCKKSGLEEWSIGLTVDRPLIKETADHWRVYLVVHSGCRRPLNTLKDMLSTSVSLDTMALPETRD